MDKYLLLFRNSTQSEEAFQDMSPEDMQASLEQWQAWIGGIAAQGNFISSDGLDNAGKIVSGTRRVLSDGPYVESKELVSGYLLMQAESEAEAVACANGCPILEMEGSVEIRKLMVY